MKLVSCFTLLLFLFSAILCSVAHAADTQASLLTLNTGLNTTSSCLWPRGGRRCCGTLKSPGVQHGSRKDETSHCFPGTASDHFVCCVDIQNVDNEENMEDPYVARHNPLSGPIRRNSDRSSYSWCVCSETICTQQLKGRVDWVGRHGST